MKIRHLTQVLLTSATLATTTSIYAEAPANTVGDAIQSARAKVYEIFDMNTAAVKFAAKSSRVTKSERQNLAALIEGMRRSGKIERAVVASWSDQEYPATKGEHLGKAARSLADARTAAVVEILHDLGIKSIDSHSMAEQPTWLATVFSGRDAKIKGTAEADTAEDQRANDLGKLLRKKGGPGTTVVVIERVGDLATH